MTKHLFIPDCQVKEGVSFEHLLLAVGFHPESVNNYIEAD